MDSTFVRNRSPIFDRSCLTSLYPQVVADLSWNDLRTLSVLASEKADDASLSISDRERWADVAGRILDSAATSNDLRAAAELVTLDAALQRDAKVRQRYLDLASRTIAAAR